LDIEEGPQWDAGDATMLVVLDLAIDWVAESGAQKAGREDTNSETKGLDFKMDRGVRALMDIIVK